MIQIDERERNCKVRLWSPVDWHDQGKLDTLQGRQGFKQAQNFLVHPCFTSHLLWEQQPAVGLFWEEGVGPDDCSRSCPT